jgi:hypothetical protein
MFDRSLIRQPILFFISVVLLLVLVGFVAERIYFLSTAKRTAGTVISVTSSNSTCGSRGRRGGSRRYPCTKYRAQVEFVAEGGRQSSFEVSAGSKRGHNSALSYANYKSQQVVPVVYDPKKISKAYIDDFMGVWGIPFMIFITQILTFFSSFFDSRKRRASS